MFRAGAIRKGAAKAADHTGGTGKKLQFMGMEDMTPLIISRIEKNQRHVCDGELRMIAKALDVTMEWLVGDSDEIKY